jgi:hypothetical protein
MKNIVKISQCQPSQNLEPLYELFELHFPSMIIHLEHHLLSMGELTHMTHIRGEHCRLQSRLIQWLKSQGNTSLLANGTRDDARDVYTDTQFPKIVRKFLLHELYVAFHSILWVYTLSTHSGASSLSPGSTLDCRWILTPILPFHIHYLSEEHITIKNHVFEDHVVSLNDHPEFHVTFLEKIQQA